MKAAGRKKRRWRFSAVVALSRKEFCFVFLSRGLCISGLLKCEVVESRMDSASLFRTVVTRNNLAVVNKGEKYYCRSTSRLALSIDVHTRVALHLYLPIGPSSRVDNLFSHQYQQ